MSTEGIDSQTQRAPARTALYILVALATPVLFFMLLEAALRSAGQHQVYPLFVASPIQPTYLQANPKVVKRYFPNRKAAPAITIETSYFLANKPDDALRIFVQGGSSAAGFPYGYGASLAGMLEQRLRSVIPELHVEVVSTAMAAVNSYTLLDFADEIIAQKPNAVLIYAGHNEYLGVLGVGSAVSSRLSPGLTRLTLRLRRFAVYQLLERLLGRTSSDTISLERGAGRTLMARIAADKSIPYASTIFEQGVEQFRGNLERLLSKYRRAGVPVILGTLASNEADLEPFAGAEDWYASARNYSALGDYTAARAHYLAAKDRDRLRFRAPEEFNRIVRDAAGRYGATVADVQEALAGASPNGIIGSEFMLEHVHPNLDGYFVLADTFFDALFESGVLVKSAELPNDAQARQQIPVSEVDRLFGEYKLLRITNDWPFVTERREVPIPEPTNEVENLAYQMYHGRISWTEAMNLLRNHYREQGDAEEEIRVKLILADAVPFAAAAQFTAGTSLIRANRAREALRYLSRAEQINPNNINALLAYSHALILNGAYDPARHRLNRVLQLDPKNVTARNALAQLHQRGKK